MIELPRNLLIDGFNFDYEITFAGYSLIGAETAREMASPQVQKWDCALRKATDLCGALNAVGAFICGYDPIDSILEDSRFAVNGLVCYLKTAPLRPFMDFAELDRLANQIGAHIGFPNVANAVRLRAKQGKEQQGYVYLLRSTTGYYKIGKTADPANRLKTFGVKLPFEVEFDCLIRAEDMTILERVLHCLYADKRVAGEWFLLSDEDVWYINVLAGAQS